MVKIFTSVNKTNAITLCAGIAVIFLISSCRPTESGQITSAEDSTWAIMGFGGGGATFNPVVSPHDPETVLLSCDMTGSYLTTDGGTSWTIFNLRGGVRQYAFDPADPKIMYALRSGSSSGLFRSMDGGRRWELCYPNPDSVKAFVARGDHAEEQLLTIDSIPRAVVSMAIDPGNAERVYVVQRVGERYRLAVSDDRGTTWRRERNLDFSPQAIFIDPGSPMENRTLYLPGDHGMAIRRDGKWLSGALPDGVTWVTAYAAGYDSSRTTMFIYAISGKSYFNPEGDRSGIFVSSDGLRWENREEGLLLFRSAHHAKEMPEWRAIATSARHPDVVYVSYANLRTGGDTTSIGVARSDDFGKTWKLYWQDKIFKGGYAISPGLDGGWIDARYGPEWGENPFSIGVSPSDPDVAYATDFGRVMKTTDGRRWKQVYTQQDASGAWSSRGIDVTSSYGVVFDPFDHDHVFMANTDVGLMESHDRGRHWSPSRVDTFLPPRWTNTAYAVVFDPAVAGRAWAAFSGVHDLPRPKMWRHKPVGTYTGGIARTDDGGKTWQPVSAGIGEGAVTHIFLDTTSNTEARTLYACVFGKGVFRSDDGGNTWQRRNTGLPETEPFAWRMFRRDSDGSLFLVIARRSEEHRIGGALDGALYRSSDGAATWTRVSLPEGTNGPMCLITDAGTPQRLLLSAWGRPSLDPWGADSGGGIFLSEDDGVNWKPVLDQDQHVHDISFDERTQTYYACGFTAAAWNSADGVTWTKIPGYDFKWGRRVDFDPVNSDRIYISTFGGGVWVGNRHGSVPHAALSPGLPVH